MAACCAAASGCVTRMTPSAEVENPVAVYVADYGRHSSLLLPVPSEEEPTSILGRTTMREYSFGDWVYYAQDQDSIRDGAKALLWKTSGTLGRRDLTDLGPAADEAPIEPTGRIQRTLGVERVFTLIVERELADALLERLDARYEQGLKRGQPVANEVVELDFVLDEKDYSVARHCNHEVRDWLRELGVEALGAPLVSEYKLLPAR